MKVPIANGHAEAYSRFQGLLYLKPQSFQYQQQQKPALQDCRVAKQVSAKTFCSNFGFIVKLTDAYHEMFSRPAYRRAGNPEVAPPGRRPGETLAHQIRRVAGIDEGQGRDRTPPRPTQSPTLHMATIDDPIEPMHVKIVSGMRSENVMMSLTTKASSWT